MKGRDKIPLKGTVWGTAATQQAVLAGLAVTCTFLAGCNAEDAANADASLTKALIPTYSVGGTVTGLSGRGLVLEDSGGDDLPVTANGSFTFATALAVDANYSVTVKAQPSSPGQTCMVSKGSGIIGAANVTNVQVSCTTNATSAPSGVGTPITDPVSKSIDAGGGSLSSGDGRLTVTIPANALSTATSISIQPISNEAPGGIGLAYRLGPSGQTFATPVTITLRYADSDLAGTSSTTLSLAYQDAQNQWNVYEQPQVDDTAQTVSVSSSHFSDWSLVSGEQLVPAQAVLTVGQTLTLNVVECQPVSSGMLVSLLAQCQSVPAAGGTTPLATWSVNGHVGGDAADGTIAAPQSADTESAVYAAPANVPAQNPVAISAETVPTPLVGKELLVSNITVVPCSESQTIPNCTWTGTATATRPGGFDPVGQRCCDYSFYVTVTWAPAPQPWNLPPGWVAFVPVSGQITAISLDPRCTFSPTSIPLDATNSFESALAVDYTQAPPQYSISGLATNKAGSVLTTRTCDFGVEGSVQAPLTSISWLSMPDGTVYLTASSDGKRLQESWQTQTATGSVSNEWKLTAGY